MEMYLDPGNSSFKWGEIILSARQKNEEPQARNELQVVRMGKAPSILN